MPGADDPEKRLPETETHDALFSAPLGAITDFSFDEQVAAVFPDMLQRSIPGYHTIIAQTGVLGARYVQPNTNCYDLGCSLGGSTLALRRQIPASAQIIAVDNSEAMVSRFNGILTTEAPMDRCAIEVRCEDINDTQIENASMVALNFTLQFVEPETRSGLLQRIYSGMNPGAALILSEKMIMEDPEFNQLFIDRYHAFKRANGYSELEISQKRTALENVLIPDTLERHQRRLVHAGFERSTVWFQCFNFLSVIALK